MWKRWNSLEADVADIREPRNRKEKMQDYNEMVLHAMSKLFFETGNLLAPFLYKVSNYLETMRKFEWIYG